MIPSRVDRAEVDVLVIGSGLAGLAAGMEAAAGASVLVVDRGGGASRLAQGGIAAALAAQDSPALHAADTLAAGFEAGDPVAVRELTEEAAAAIAWLAAHDVEFDRDPDGAYAPALEGAHSRPRVLRHGDSTGAAIMAALERRAVRQPGLTRLTGASLLGLRVGGEACAGARFVGPDGCLEVIAGATVLATGGYAALYATSTAAPGADGEGIVAALRAGAELADLEFVQFHPTAYAGPGQTFLVTEALRGAGAVLLDRTGNRFLHDVDDRGELAPRAVVARAMAGLMSRTGDPHVFLDCRSLPRDVLRTEFPGFLGRCAGVGLDPTRELVPVRPAAHFTMGGVVTDLRGRTSVPGLLAAGECARTGFHGANRLASNSLLEAVVMGRRAGQAALSGAGAPGRAGGGGPAMTPPELAGRSPVPPELGRILDRDAGLSRSEAGLDRARSQLAAWSDDRGPVGAAAGLAALIASSARLRRETRGSHAREDFPETDPTWNSAEVRIRMGTQGVPRVEVARRPSGASALETVPPGPRAGSPSRPAGRTMSGDGSSGPPG